MRDEHLDDELASADGQDDVGYDEAEPPLQARLLEPDLSPFHG